MNTAGVIRGKYLRSHVSLRYLTIVLNEINDLYILLDGLVPNLITLSVIICEQSIDEQIPLPKSWPHQSMSSLKKFDLKVNGIVKFTYKYLCNIVIPLINVTSLTLQIENYVHSNSEQFIQWDALFEQFLPQLKDFNCSIWTSDTIDIQANITNRN